MANNERKIIIDEDWKAQIRREKEEAAQKIVDEEATLRAEEAPASVDESSDEDDLSGIDEEALMRSPFLLLLRDLTTQALISLGGIAQPGQDRVMVDVESGKMIIDMLAALRDKTNGNLTRQESAMLTQSLAELHRLLAMRVQQAQEAALRQAGVDPANPKAWRGQ